jgi:hypothetical protein
MAQGQDLFETVVRNTSPDSKFFGFLGAHGVRLAAGATHSQPGNLLTDLAGRRSNRAYNSLVEQLAGGTLTVMKTPTVFVPVGDNVGAVQTIGDVTGGNLTLDAAIDTDADNDGIPDVIEE